MRHAIELGNLIITTDNSGGIGEKPRDIVKASDRITAKFAARVCLLEQWAAGAEPEAVLLHNFSGKTSWSAYCEGIGEVFQEIGKLAPPISGSSETNMQLQQSAVAVTFIGRQKSVPRLSEANWFTYGRPLVGEAVLSNSSDIASLTLLQEAREQNLVEKIWPVGSSGILAELAKADPTAVASANSSLNLSASAGPATVVLLRIKRENQCTAQQLFGHLLRPLSTQ